ncbi:RagB/SusD family nutrient uptake outer membrane protein [Chitinophaga sp. sic0106]|uniref:RagB/SusD family nutrient uptake outer membrane protein n=1 Tax=Chitinophaga sp. sic0106 TaxID=2854785 RepID=UPI001C445782|nr:RagB/SusD family nutrient uptake outer membrane protein [Chitinophaga sp. sic0106]MBV7529224.1 RagB/SusD family nutrient uptake outer membrane protein [Chitinophaga sp. sic0106]
MKKNIIFGLLAGGLVCFASCTKDILDKKPQDSINEITVWNDIGLVGNYVNYFYSTLQSGYTRGYYLSAATDDGMNGLANDIFFIKPLTMDASWNATNAPFNGYYTSTYQNIRKANDFLAHIDGVKGDSVLKRQMKAEIRFFRAYYYTELLNFFGDDPIKASGAAAPSGLVDGYEDALGVVLIEKAQQYGTDTLNIPRSTRRETVNYITGELDEVATALGSLPASFTSPSGRLTKGAAMALKARVLLYAGRFQAAAAAAKAVMDLGTYSLYPDYKTLFTVKNNAECILSVQHNNMAKERGHTYDRDMAVGSMSGFSRSNPTQNLINDYEMTDGKLPLGSDLYNPATPYANRDARFYASVAYDGANYRGSVLQTYANGFDQTNAGLYETQTTYLVRKACNESFNFLGDATYGSDQNWQYLRYAEILLNYAEAQNEATGPDATVYNAVNAIRTRAKQPALPEGLNQDQMRQRIRHERRIEFAFEDQRFWDVRRWHIADKDDFKKIYGASIKLSGATKVYGSPVLLESRFFELKNYCMPIPNAELQANSKMIQNTYWK